MGGELSVAVGPDTASSARKCFGERGRATRHGSSPTSRGTRDSPQDALARVKAGLLRDLAIQKSTPQAVAGEHFAALVYGDHPYGRHIPDRGDARRLHARAGPGLPPRTLRSEPRAPVRRGRVRRGRRWRLPSARRSARGRASRVRGAARAARQTAARLRAHRPPRRAAVHDPPRRARARPVERGLRSPSGDELAARRLIRLAHHLEHPRAEGLRLLPVQPISATTSRRRTGCETADVTTANTGDSLEGDQERDRRACGRSPRRPTSSRASRTTWPARSSSATPPVGRHQPARIRRPARARRRLPGKIRRSRAGRHARRRSRT